MLKTLCKKSLAKYLKLIEKNFTVLAQRCIVKQGVNTIAFEDGLSIAVENEYTYFCLENHYIANNPGVVTQVVSCRLHNDQVDLSPAEAPTCEGAAWF